MAHSFRGNELDTGVFPKLVDLRTGFVRRMGWPLNGEKDGDRYDHLADTEHYFTEGELGEIRSTMRLTKVDSIDEILSLEMLTSNLEMQGAARQHLVALYDEDPQLEIHDLTRLVFNPTLRRNQMPDPMLRMFVPAMMETALCRDNPQSTVWVFAVMEGMSSVLGGMGVDSTSLARGRVSEGDPYKTEFCYIRPFEATKAALDSDEPRHELAADLIRRGLGAQKSL